jgi:hypothetical protein
LLPVVAVPLPLSIVRGTGEVVIKSGEKVRIKESAFLDTRYHLQQHARYREIGTIIEPSPAATAVAQIYIIVKFEECGQRHRLLADEIEPVR